MQECTNCELEKPLSSFSHKQRNKTRSLCYSCSTIKSGFQVGDYADCGYIFGNGFVKEIKRVSIGVLLGDFEENVNNRSNLILYILPGNIQKLVRPIKNVPKSQPGNLTKKKGKKITIKKGVCQYHNCNYTNFTDGIYCSKICEDKAKALKALKRKGNPSTRLKAAGINLKLNQSGYFFFPHVGLNFELVSSTTFQHTPNYEKIETQIQHMLPIKLERDSDHCFYDDKKCLNYHFKPIRFVNIPNNREKRKQLNKEHLKHLSCIEHLNSANARLDQCRMYYIEPDMTLRCRGTCANEASAHTIDDIYGIGKFKRLKNILDCMAFCDLLETDKETHYNKMIYNNNKTINNIKKKHDKYWKFDKYYYWCPRLFICSLKQLYKEKNKLTLSVLRGKGLVGKTLDITSVLTINNVQNYFNIAFGIEKRQITKIKWSETRDIIQLLMNCLPPAFSEMTCLEIAMLSGFWDLEVWFKDFHMKDFKGDQSRLSLGWLWW